MGTVEHSISRKEKKKRIFKILQRFPCTIVTVTIIQSTTFLVSELGEFGLTTTRIFFFFIYLFQFIKKFITELRSVKNSV